MLQIPGATSYIGSIGKDKFAELMKHNSKLAGVNVSLGTFFNFPVLLVSNYLLQKSMIIITCIQVQYYEDETAATGTCAVCVVGGER